MDVLMRSERLPRREGSEFAKIGIETAKTTFCDPYAKSTLAIIDLFYIRQNLKAWKVVSKIFQNGRHGRHAEIMALDWLVEHLRECPPRHQNPGDFVSIELYISRSPCPGCTKKILSFFHSNLDAFVSSQYFINTALVRDLEDMFSAMNLRTENENYDGKDDALGIFEINFPHGYYQDSPEYFTHPIKTITNAGDNDKGVLIFPNEMDLVALGTLIENVESIDLTKTFPSYNRKYDLATTAVAKAMKLAEPARVSRIELQQYLNPTTNRRGAKRGSGTNQSKSQRP